MTVMPCVLFAVRRGADAGIKDLDEIAYIDRAMDDVGVDSIEIAVAFANSYGRRVSALGRR